MLVVTFRPRSQRNKREKANTTKVKVMIQTRKQPHTRTGYDANVRRVHRQSHGAHYRPPRLAGCAPRRGPVPTPMIDDADTTCMPPYVSLGGAAAPEGLRAAGAGAGAGAGASYDVVGLPMPEPPAPLIRRDGCGRNNRTGYAQGKREDQRRSCTNSRLVSKGNGE